MWCCIFIFAFSLLCTVTHFIVLFALGETVKSANQNIKSKHMWMRLSVAYDLPSSLSFPPFLSLFLTFPFLSRLLSYCLSSKHSWLIWPWGPGLPASLRVSPSLTQLKPAGSSALGVIAYESPALPKDQLSLSIPASLPTKRRRTKQNKSKPPKSVTHTILETILDLLDFISSLYEESGMGKLIAARE